MTMPRDTALILGASKGLGQEISRDSALGQSLR